MIKILMGENKYYHNPGRREDFHRGTREGSLLGDEEFQHSLDVPTTALSPALFTFADLSEIAHRVYRFYGQPVIRLQEKRRSREMTKLRGRVALFYTEKAGLLQEVA